jgi:hypothetical protein
MQFAESSPSNYTIAQKLNSLSLKRLLAHKVAAPEHFQCIDFYKFELEFRLCSWQDSKDPIHSGK